MARGNGNSKTVVNMNEARASRQQRPRKRQNTPKNQNKSKDVQPNNRRVLLSYSLDVETGDQLWVDDYVIYEDNGRFFEDHTDGYTNESTITEITAAAVLIHNETAKQSGRSSSGDVLQLLSAKDEDWISMEAELGFTTPESSRNVKVNDSVQSTEDDEVDEDGSEETSEESTETDVMAGLSAYERGIFADVEESYFAKYNEAVKSGHLLDLSGKPIPTFLRAINSYNRGVNDIGFLYIVDAEGKVLDAETALNADECYLACKDASQFKNGLFSRFVCKAIKDYPKEVVGSQASYFGLYPEYFSVREKEFEENEYDVDSYPLVSFVDGFPLDGDITVADMQKKAKENPEAFLALAQKENEEWEEYNKSFAKFEANWNAKEKQRQEKVVEEAKQKQAQADKELLEAQIAEAKMEADAVNEYDTSAKAAQEKAKWRPSHDVSKIAHVDMGKANYTREEQLRQEAEEIRSKKKSEASAKTNKQRARIRKYNEKLERDACERDDEIKRMYDEAENKVGKAKVNPNVDNEKGDTVMKEPETKLNQSKAPKKTSEKVAESGPKVENKVTLKDRLHSLYMTVAEKTRGPREEFAEKVKYNAKTVGESFSKSYAFYKARQEANKSADYAQYLEKRGQQVTGSFSSASSKNKPQYSAELLNAKAAEGFKAKIKRNLGDVGRSMKMFAATYRNQYDILKFEKLDNKAAGYRVKAEDAKNENKDIVNSYYNHKADKIDFRRSKIDARMKTYSGYFASVQESLGTQSDNGVDISKLKVSQEELMKSQIIEKLQNGMNLSMADIEFLVPLMDAPKTRDEAKHASEYFSKRSNQVNGYAEKVFNDTQQVAETEDGEEVMVLAENGRGHEFDDTVNSEGKSDSEVSL